MTFTDHVLITGAGGLTGSHSIRFLHAQGIRVAGLYKTTPEGELPWPVFSGDLADHQLEHITGETSQFSAIVHCAAYLPQNNQELEKALEINKRIDENITSYAAGKKIRLVYLSGTSVYGCSEMIFTEESDPHPEGEYVTGKYNAEIAIKKQSDNYVILRVSAPYGPFQKSRTVLRIFIENALADKPLLYYGSGEREQDFTYIKDVARAIFNSVRMADVSGTFNIASGNPVSMKALAGIVLQNIPGSKSEIRASGLPDDQENCRAKFSIEKANKLLHWQPQTNIAQGIQNWLTHFKDEDRRSQ